jgi:hypothetical protein
MTAACITFDEIESRAASTVALTLHLRRVRAWFFAFTLGAPGLSILDNKLSDLVKTLNCGILERASDEQLKELSELLRPLHFQLLKLPELVAQGGLDRFVIIRNRIRSIENRTEDVESILENVYLALNPDFRSAVSLAVEKLRPGVEDCATLFG